MTSALALVAAMGACATAGAAPCPDRAIGVSLAEAKTLVATFEKDLAQSDDDGPIRQPRTLDDVLEILKLDQINLFQGGVTLAAQTEGLKAKVLQAQIELSWGEAQTVLADLFFSVAANDRAHAKALEARRASGGLSASQAQDLTTARQNLVKFSDLADALNRLAAEHSATGVALARKVMEARPDDYAGYRLAADYYRVREDWLDFDKMVSAVEQKNPSSNGLLFLRAMSAIHRYGQVARGQLLLSQALERDPKFARAAAELVLTAETPERRYEALTKLAAINPRHQIVVWLGDSIKAAYMQEQSEQAAGTRLERQMDRAKPSGGGR